MSGREDMVAAMESCLGMTERDGSQNKVQAWYRNRNGAAYSGNFAWCDATISWAAYVSGNHDAVCFGKDYAYTVAHAAKFQAEGRWHTDIAGIQRGDIVFFDWSGTNNIANIDHVGIVTSVSGTTVYTVEGNIGNVCARKVRYSNYIVGYGRPAYPAPAKPSTGTGVKYQPFPGASWFKQSPKSSIVTRMGKRLVAEKCSAYKSGPGPQWTTVDRASYQKWQLKLGYKGTQPGGAADGWPGKTSWDKLKVPVA